MTAAGIGIPLLLALVVAGCALFNPSRGLKDCRYHFRSFAFAAVDNVKTTWTIEIAVANPNARPVSLEKMRFALLHGSDTLVTGWNPSRKELPARDSTVLQATLDLPHSIIKRLPPGILSDAQAEFNLVGDAYLQTWIGEIQVPGAVKRTIHVDMPAQMAKVRTLFMQRLFRGFGGLVPKADSPAPGSPAPPAAPSQDEPL